MTGFDSESDRRDAIRKQIVNECISDVLEKIRNHGPTGTPEERRYLEVTIARRLLKGEELEAMSQMMRQEIGDAEKKLDD